MADTPGPTATPRPARMAWEVPVLDVRDRRRMLVVVIADGQVVMLGPPGEAWTVPPESDAVLIDALRAARAVARQLHDWPSAATPPGGGGS